MNVLQALGYQPAKSVTHHKKLEQHEMNQLIQRNNSTENPEELALKGVGYAPYGPDDSQHARCHAHVIPAVL
jgi:hypothetical protein